MATLERRVMDLEYVVAHLPEDLDARFAGMDVRFASIREVQLQHTQRFTAMERRLDGIETRLGGLETRLDHLETRVGGIETRLDGLGSQLAEVLSRLPPAPG